MTMAIYDSKKTLFRENFVIFVIIPCPWQSIRMAETERPRKNKSYEFLL